VNDIDQLLKRPEFPRSSAYDPSWMVTNQMGPNAVWLLEWLTAEMNLSPGMRVLDLGCGKAMTSIFLAKEFDVHVHAADLWIGPDANWKRVVEMGVEDRVCPLRAQAHALPFAHGYFDAIVSIDAYHYFGTDQLYLGYAATFLKEGGQIGIAVPGLMQPVEGEVPEYLSSPQENGKVFWERECWSFDTAERWRERWERSGKIAVERVDTLDDGWRHWRDFEKAVEIAGTSPFPSDAEALDKDQGRTIGFIRAIGTRTSEESMDLYDPTIGVRLGVEE
jgi:SAM-dependent methyltransferase